MQDSKACKSNLVVWFGFNDDCGKLILNHNLSCFQAYTCQKVHPPEISITKNFSVSILESVSQKKKLRGERLPFLKTLMLAVTCTSSHFDDTELW